MALGVLEDTFCFVVTVCKIVLYIGIIILRVIMMSYHKAMFNGNCLS